MSDEIRDSEEMEMEFPPGKVEPMPPTRWFCSVCERWFGRIGNPTWVKDRVVCGECTSRGRVPTIPKEKRDWLDKVLDWSVPFGSGMTLAFLPFIIDKVNWSQVHVPLGVWIGLGINQHGIIQGGQLHVGSIILAGMGIPVPL